MIDMKKTDDNFSEEDVINFMGTNPNQSPTEVLKVLYAMENAGDDLPTAYVGRDN